MPRDPAHGAGRFAAQLGPGLWVCEARRRLPTDDQADALAGLAWAVAHPARVRILRLLLARDTCVCGEIVDQMPLAQSTVSQHLKIL